MIAAGVVGNVLEWYDFALFGVLAPVIASLFFPSADPLAGLISSYAVFAIGFLARPLLTSRERDGSAAGVGEPKAGATEPAFFAVEMPAGG